jgi:ABC-2 type transport system permease protein
MIYTIAQHEFLKLFKSGKIWKLLALCQFLLGSIFYWLISEFTSTSERSLLENYRLLSITEEVVHPLFAWTVLLFFFITPLLASIVLTQERKSNTLDLYLGSPISPGKIMVGKFFGAFAAQLFLLTPTLLMPLFLTIHYSLDVGHLITGSCGLILLLASSLSVALLIASFAREPMLVILVSFVVLLFLSLLEWGARFLTMKIELFSDLSLLYHCKNFLSGMINTQDLVYYCTITLVCLYISSIRLGKEARFRR